MSNTQMKHLKTDLMVIVALSTIFLIIAGLFLFVGYLETHYTVKAKIVEIDGNTYTMETKNGHQFKVEMPEHKVGDTVELHMVTNNTDNFYDDEIEEVEIGDHSKITLE